ncbi:MAG: flagellar M-ring protein FliF, partial [Planctomycetota bacterium]
LPAPLRQWLGPLGPEIERIGVRRVALLASLALVITAAIVGITWFSSRERMVPLYRDLELADAGAVTSRLRDKGVPYELRDGGRTIAVPASKVHELRIELASDGLPESGGVGFELFDRTSFGASDLVEQVNLLRALQGELARSIMRLEPVAHATVHIAQPRQTVFSRRQKRTTASVVLSLKRGRHLSSQQVAGIVHLVSHAVEGLAPEDVTVVDRHGITLAPREGVGGGAGGGAPALSLQQEVEQHLSAKAQSMLDAALGPGRAFVRVVAELDMQRIEETRERFDPDAQVARSETTSSRTVRSQTPNAGRAGGSTGARAALAKAGGGAGQTTESEEKITTQYEIGHSVQKIVKVPGGIRRLSVSLVIDESLSDKLEQIEGIVKTAVGFDPRRGDSFDRAAVARAQKDDPWDDPDLVAAAQRRELIEIALRHGLPGLAGLIITISMLGLARRSRRAAAAPAPEPADGAGETTIGQRLDLRTPETLEPGPDGTHPAVGLATVEALADELRRAAQQDPQAAAALLRAWLRSGVDEATADAATREEALA